MEILNINTIDPLESKDISLFLDCDITNDDEFPTNDVSVVISVFDTTDNFIDQKVIDGTNFKYDWDNERDFLAYIYDDILDINSNENLNPGIYNLRFSFITDTFNVIDNTDNRFIVTEISPDQTEIRLNPLSNEEGFINHFSKFKKQKKLEKDIELNERGFIGFYREYVNFVFSESNINDIFSDSEVQVDGKPFTEYLISVLKERNEEVSDSDKTNNPDKYVKELIESMIVDLKSEKDNALIFISKYFENVKNELFRMIRNTSPDDSDTINSILNTYKVSIRTEMKRFIDNSIDEIVETRIAGNSVSNEITEGTTLHTNALDPVSVSDWDERYDPNQDATVDL